jgi:uncharacterized protein Veg
MVRALLALRCVVGKDIPVRLGYGRRKKAKRWGITVDQSSTDDHVHLEC